ncbi:DUF4292 domain-containing protein [Flavobacterium sp.]|uniref:DUF4292 domain-containing protein n=1 Tax=Flavobacterium sp. TaxID=239 RepID=UPI00261DBB11|nr:DUF4292 domain-containing protein [Flavobacterium sp.]
MRKIVPILLIALLLFSCKSKQKLVPSKEITATTSNETISNIINNHYALKRDFKTAYIKADVDYTDPKQSLSLSADIRIKKDEIILVSVKFFGIVMAKAIITPTQVRYYEKAGNKYFEGDYKTLSNWLGTDLDFKKVQNMLLGQAMDDLTKGKYSVLSEEKAPKLEEVSEGNFTKAFVFNESDFSLKRQEITQQTPARKLLVNYLNYKTFPESVLPGELLIFATEEDKTTSISIAYKNATFNEDLSFPYSVPSGYERIIIN